MRYSALVRICAGGVRQRTSLPRLNTDKDGHNHDGFRRPTSRAPTAARVAAPDLENLRCQISRQRTSKSGTRR